ncbi:MAG: DUF1616 domain-containing protein [Candidatus Bathyarchaeota archaeon]|nr:DUF1616 domain-containing protein [Candidatus Bathyarchaeota archaeon]
MVTKTALLVAYLIVLVLTPSFVWAQSNLEVTQNSITDAYNAIVKATATGADTSHLISQLNQAINLTEQSKKIASSDPQQAAIYLNQAHLLTQNVTQQANAADQSTLSILPILPVVAAILVIAVGVIVYFFGPKFFWASWLHLRRNYRVNFKKINGASKADLIVTFEQVCAVFLVLTILIAAVSVSGLFTNEQGEPFSELGILGSNLQLEDYPSEIIVGQTVHFYGYVGNRMGQPQYYTVMVKLGNNDTQVNPAAVTSIQQYSQVLAHNQSWIFPIDISLTTVGDSQRIIFELWLYNATTQQTQYHQRWGQLWLNIVAPAS